MGNVLQYFSLAIFIIVLIRLFLIMTGEMSMAQKISKAGYWIVGIIMITISWKILDAVFPGVDLGSPFSNKSVEQFQMKDSYRKNTVGDEKDTMYIKIDTGNE